jgi:hypothetical protein
MLAPRPLRHDREDEARRWVQLRQAALQRPGARFGAQLPSSTTRSATAGSSRRLSRKRGSTFSACLETTQPVPVLFHQAHLDPLLLTYAAPGPTTRPSTSSTSASTSHEPLLQ